MKKIKVALIGFGGIARAHNAAYKMLTDIGYPVSLVAVCEKNIEQIKTNISINIDGGDSSLPDNIHIYTDVDELIKNEDFDLADICLPTFLHKDFSVKLLMAGKHVICEKPMALNSDDCNEMLMAANKNHRILMIAQCLRFDSYYLYLKKIIDTEPFGKLRHLYLYRQSIYPRWGSSFASSDKTGGCILDTHIHDVDMARFLLGEPEYVSAIYYDNEPYIQTVNSRLIFGDVTVIADCSWDESRSVDFESGYRACFEKATVVFDGEKLTVYPCGEAPYSPEIVKKDRISEEIRAICDSILAGESFVNANPTESAKNSISLIETLKESAKETGKIIKI